MVSKAYVQESSAPYNSTRARFINDFFEQYLKLSEEEEEKLMQEISQSENPEAFTKLPNSWEERGIRKGIEQGIAEGKKEVVLKMLKEGFSIEVIGKVTDLDTKTIEKLRKMN